MNHKGELQLLLTQTSALTIKKVDLKVDDLSSKMDVLLRFIQQQSPLEQSVSKKIARYGGEERALNVSSVVPLVCSSHSYLAIFRILERWLRLPKAIFM